MFLHRSTWRKLLVSSVGIVTFALLFEVTVLDSRQHTLPLPPTEETAAPAPGVKLRFTATAYCRGTTTASGVNVRSGIAAADPDLLPVGSVVRVERLPEKYNGVYTVMDTGPKVHGRHLDIYIWNCDEAVRFGRRPAMTTVLRMGWNPLNSTPGLVERLFRQRESVLPPRPVWPSPQPRPSSPEPPDASPQAPAKPDQEAGPTPAG